MNRVLRAVRLLVVVTSAYSVHSAFSAVSLHAQAPTDSIRKPVQDGIFNRPVVGSVGRTAIGGYVEGNSNYAVEDGIGEGFSMELRRFNIFLFSSIGSRIRFISELEFEHGTEEIALETALIDLTFSPSFVVRAGIILPPLGAFNVNHDSPRWNFVDRPIVSTEIIPSTLSEVGFGIHGRLTPPVVGLTYDLYVTNGLTDGVIANEAGRTRLASGKSEEAFAEDNNGSPAISGRLAAQHPRFGELGASFYTAIYNTFQMEGEPVDEQRRVTLVALDAQTQVGPVELRGEIAATRVDVPDDLAELYGSSQIGWHLDATTVVWRPQMLGLPDAAVSADLRLEGADFNRGRFSSTGRRIGDEVLAVVIGTSFRPVSGTVLKVNYRRATMRDFARNPAASLAAFQVGFATYF
jgi:hypothetical protein